MSSSGEPINSTLMYLAHFCTRRIHCELTIPFSIHIPFIHSFIHYLSVRYYYYYYYQLLNNNLIDECTFIALYGIGPIRTPLLMPEVNIPFLFFSSKQ